MRTGPGFCRTGVRRQWPVGRTGMSESMAIDMLNLKVKHVPIDVILVCIRWSAADPLSCRHLVEMMEERAVLIDHSTIYRWAIGFFR